MNFSPRDPAPPIPFIRTAQVDDMSQEQTHYLISHLGFHSWHHESLLLLLLFSSLQSIHYSPHFIRLRRHDCHWLCSANQGSCVIRNLGFCSSRSFSFLRYAQIEGNSRVISLHDSFRWQFRPMSRQPPVLHALRTWTLHLLICVLRQRNSANT